MSNITRISDLPDNVTMQVQQPQNNGGYNTFIDTPNFSTGSTGFTQQNPQSGIGAGYVPINVHPNPYGNNAIPAPLSIPQQPNDDNKTGRANGNNGGVGAGYISPEQLANFNSQQQQNGNLRLPSRDIPMDSSQYQQDEEIVANYIPKTKTTEYIDEDEEYEQKEVIKQEKRQKKKEQMDDLFGEFQVPLFIAFLFFIANMPFINTLLYKYLGFLGIFKNDGNMNYYGLMLKSFIFGIVFYSINRGIEVISSL